MGKRTTEKDGAAKILYQKSNTIYTQSKTCSGVSQLYTKKSVAKIKDNLRHSKIEAKRRDLSIETDICVLRRFCKNVKNKLSEKEDTTPTRHPIATEIKAVAEFQPPDTSACGDTACKPTKTINRNFTDIFIQNFKTILKKWIEKHIIDEEMTTENLQTILTTLLKKDSANSSNKSASRSTYVLDKVPETSVDSKEETIRDICKKCFKKLGHVQESVYYCDTCRMSLPVSLNKLRIISTLSIPRNLHIKVKNLNKKKCDRNKKKSKKKNLVLSFNKSSQFNLSSVDFLSISAESFTKRCANYANCKGKKIEPKPKKKRLNVFFPKANKKSSSETFVRKQWTRIGKSENTLSEMASLVQTIFANDTIHIESTEDSDVIQVNDNYTMTEDRESVTYSQKTPKTSVSDKIINTTSLQASFKKLNELDQSESMLTIDFPNQSSHFVMKDEVAASDTSPAISSVDKNKTRIKKHHYKVIKNKCFRNQTINQRIKNKINKIQQQRLTKYSNIYKNDFPFRFPNDNPISGIRNFFEYWQDVIKYFSEDIKNDLKLDVQINIAPVADVTNQDNFTLMSKQDLAKSVANMNETLVFNFNHSKHTFTNNAPETDCLTDATTIDESIPIASPIISNNLIKDLSDIRETSKPDDHMSTASKGTLTDTKIMDDIKELKQIIKDLTRAAKVFMSSGSNEYLEVDKSKQPGGTKCGTSKSIQTAGHTAGNTSPVSVIKVSRGPKGTIEFITRMLKRSVSYSVIDSEQILRVTDMTSTANRIKSSINNLPKSRSLIEITSDRKRKLITYFCNSLTSTNLKKMQKSLGRKAEEYSSATDSTILSYSKTDMNYRRDCGLDCCTYTGPQPDAEQGLCACSKEIKPCRRKLGSKEGAIYCMILWIPIIVIVSLFAVFFVGDYVTPNSIPSGLGPLKQYADDPMETPAKNHETSGSADQFSIKMSDLGF